MAISTKNSKFWYILGHFPKIQTISDFEKKEFRGYLDFYKNNSSIHEIVTFYIFVNIKVKIGTFDAKKLGLTRRKIGKMEELELVDEFQVKLPVQSL